jgi:hypothetical protein
VDECVEFSKRTAKVTPLVWDYVDHQITEETLIRYYARFPGKGYRMMYILRMLADQITGQTVGDRGRGEGSRVASPDRYG